MIAIITVTKTYQSAHEAILPQIEYCGIPNVCKRSEVMIDERFRNELVCGFMWDHVLSKGHFPLSQSVQFRPKVSSLLGGDLRSL